MQHVHYTAIHVLNHGMNFALNNSHANFIPCYKSIDKFMYLPIHEFCIK